MKIKKNSLPKFVIMLILLMIVIGILNPSKLVFLPENIRFVMEEFATKYFANSVVASINIYAILAASLTVFETWLVAQIVKTIIGSIKIKNGHKATIYQLFSDLCKYVIYLVGWSIALSCFGVDASAIFASIGIIGIVVGFGAQSLIEDVITGLFIIFEGEFEVGDIVSIDGFRGTVKTISLRTVSLVDSGGNVRIINNSEIGSLVNLSNVQSVAVVNVPVSHEHSLAVVEKVIRETLETIPNLYPEIFKDTPVYQGVDEIDGGNLLLLITASVKEQNVYTAKRIILREIKLAYEKNEINIYVE